MTHTGQCPNRAPLDLHHRDINNMEVYFTLQINARSYLWLNKRIFYLLRTSVNETVLSAEMTSPREKDIDLAFMNALVAVYEISHNGQSSVVDTA